MNKRASRRVVRRRSLALIPLIAFGILTTLASGGGGGDGGGGGGGAGTNTAPQISNLRLIPDSADFMEGGGSITVEADFLFTDPDSDMTNDDVVRLNHKRRFLERAISRDDDSMPRRRFAGDGDIGF